MQGSHTPKAIRLGMQPNGWHCSDQGDRRCRRCRRVVLGGPLVSGRSKSIGFKRKRGANPTSSQCENCGNSLFSSRPQLSRLEVDGIWAVTGTSSEVIRCTMSAGSQISIAKH